MRRPTPTRSLGTALAFLAAAGLTACAGGEEADTGGADTAADARAETPTETAGETAADSLRRAPDAERRPGRQEARDGSQETRDGRQDGRAASQEVDVTVREGLVVRGAGDGEQALLALDSAAAPADVPAVPTSWRPAADATFRIGATTFRHVVPSPDGRWVAWEAGSTHDLVGVVPSDGGPVSVLDFYFDSSAEELAWAPGGRYLVARYLPPSGMLEARVYDAEAGTRLRAPWEEACQPQDGCRVTGAEWSEAATLVVTTADGEERRHEADVAELPARPAPSDTSRAE